MYIYQGVLISEGLNRDQGSTVQIFTQTVYTHVGAGFKDVCCSSLRWGEGDG